MKLISILILVAIGLFLTIKQLQAKNYKTAALFMVGSAIVIGLVTNLIYDNLYQPPDVKTFVTPSPSLSASPEPTTTPPTPTNTPKPVDKISLLNTDTYYSDGLKYYEEDIFDNQGNKYIGYATMESGKNIVDYDGEAVFQNKNYSRFTGRVITSKRFRNCDNCGWIRIYGDEELLFDSGEIVVSKP